jgi:hypothetical protein
MKYTRGQFIKCENCGEDLEDPVQDHVIPGRIGPNSRAESECFGCGWTCTVQKDADLSYDVEPSE